MAQSGDGAGYRAAFSAEKSSIAPASTWLQDCCRQAEVPQDALDRLDICLNEVMANIVSHGGPKAVAHPVEITLTFSDQPPSRTANLVIADAGVAFDPTSASQRPQAQSLADAQPGGLGVIMLNSNADKLLYSYSNGLNTLAITVCWPLGVDNVVE